MKGKTKKILAGVIILAVVLGGGYSWFSRDREDPAAAGEAAVLPPVTAGSQIIVEGKVVPAQGAALSFSVAGLAAEIPVQEGQTVEKGQLLFRLENSDLAAQLSKAQANLARARAAVGQVSGSKQGAISRAESDYSSAESSLIRSKELFRQGAITQRELDDAAAAFKKAEASLKEAKASMGGQESDPGAMADVAYAAAAVEEMRIAMGKTEIRAPFAGTVAYLDGAAGEYIQPGVPVVQLAGAGGWEIETSDLTELNIAQVRVGDKVDLAFDGLPELKMSGTITHISTFGQLMNGDITYTARIRPDQQDSGLRWNMTAIATIETDR